MTNDGLWRRMKCTCGEPATVCVVVHWKTKDRHYDYCEFHAALVADLSGVEVLTSAVGDQDIRAELNPN